MIRTATVPLVFLAVLLLATADALAQAWPGVPIENAQWRGSGYYLSWPKMLAMWLVFVMWVYTTDWVSRDVQEIRKLTHLRWNPIVFGTFFVAMVLAWILPSFWIGLPLLLIAYFAPLISYVVVRNKQVMAHERVMTRDHIRHWLATRVSKVGVKMATEKADPHESGPPVKVLPRGGPTERDENARLGLARQQPGLLEARKILAAGLQARSSAIMLDFTPQGAAVRYLVDGVWIDREPMPLELADPALVALKILCGASPQERVKRQEGPFAADLSGTRFLGTLTTQGTPTGERVLMQFEEKGVRFKDLAELGMRDKMVEQLKALLGQDRGFVLISAMPANGLRTLSNVTLRSMDRLMRDFVAVEDVKNTYEAVENVPVTTYNAAANESPATLLQKLLRTEPNVVVCRDLVNAESLKMLLEFLDEENRMVVSTMRAKDSAEAVLRVVALGIGGGELAKTLTVTINQRLIRKLCDCKEAFPPTPEMLQQLGIPPGRVQAFYRPPTPNPEEKKEICKLCGGIGYRGRTAIFEMLVVGDNVRKALAGSAKLDMLRAAARKDGMRTLQEEGVLLVAKGVTSLPELMRVMKQ